MNHFLILKKELERLHAKALFFGNNHLQVCLAVYKGLGRKFHLHYVNFNDESIYCDLDGHGQTETHCLSVTALKQVDRVSFSVSKIYEPLSIKGSVKIL